jgi:hypothetical protein
MKNLALVLAAILITSAIKADWQPSDMESPGVLRGRIVGVAKDGIVVDGAFRRDVTTGDSIFAGPFFLIGFKREAIDGMAIEVKALPAGTHTYSTAFGLRTVKALRYSDD